MKLLLTCVTLVAVCVTVIDASCFRGTATKWISDYGKVNYYCEYKGVQFLAHTSFKTKDCYRCTCTKDGLQCCGFGFKAGVIAIAENSKCIPVANNCRLKWVKRSNGKRCPKRFRGK